MGCGQRHAAGSLISARQVLRLPKPWLCSSLSSSMAGSIAQIGRAERVRTGSGAQGCASGRVASQSASAARPSGQGKAGVGVDMAGGMQHGQRAAPLAGQASARGGAVGSLSLAMIWLANGSAARAAVG